VSDSPSRRNFLFGRAPATEDRWLLFLSRLRRACLGAVAPLGAEQARLVPGRFDDVLQARELCSAFGVCMALEGLALPEADNTRRVLWVQAGSAWGSLMPLGDTGHWRVDAGCPVAGMQAAGLLWQPQSGSPENLAQWLATVGRERPNLDHLGLVSVEWLFADGTIEVLGAFGQADSQPLRSLKAQKTIPKLFELSAEPIVQQSFEKKWWPGTFRIDALVRTPAVNLANVVVGSGGALGWLVAATFDQNAVQAPAVFECQSRAAQTANEAALWLSLDQQVKGIMDPENLFVSPPN
jgi:hypothetical protein